MSTDHAQDALEPFFRPHSVAMIGVSPNWSYINTIFKQFVSLGVPEKVYPVNPNYPAVEGITAYPRLIDIPDPVDLVLISVPARLVPDAMQQCEQKGVKGINILTSGFAEIGGDEGERRHSMMTDFAKRTGIRIVGPNCYGNISVPDKFAGMPNTTLAVSRPLGRLSLAFQSGGLAINVVSACMDRYIGLAYVVSTGNEPDVEVADCVEYFAQDEHTQLIACYVEQFRNPQKFLEAAELCAERRKPIVVLKVGRSEAGRRMAQAHTGALAGSDRVVDAVLRRHGVSRVYSIDEMMETVAILHSRKLPAGDGVGVLTLSGGANAVITDLAEEIGVHLPPLREESQQIVRSALYDYITVTNPLDITGPGIQELHVHRAALDALGSDSGVHIILHQAGGTGRMDAQGPGGRVLLAAMQKYPEKIWLKVGSVAGTYHDKPRGMPDLVEPITELEGVPFMQGTENVLRAVKALIRYAEYQRRRADGKASGQEEDTANAEVETGHLERSVKARAILGAAQRRALTETEGKQVLELYGISVARERLATTAAQAARSACEIGYPVAMKIASPQITHKTEAGGVALNIRSDQEALEAYERIVANARHYDPKADLQGVTVQEMVTGGHELIVGMTHDEQFGAGILLGLGGIWVEVLKDVAVRIPPLNATDVREMVGSLKGNAILSGARGAKPADVDALVDVLLKFSRLCLDLQDDVREIDINPLVVLDAGCGVKAVDCLIVPASAARS